MDFHEVEVRGIGLVNDFPDRIELLLDLDYILKWVNLPDRQGLWVSPATLVFKSVFELKMTLQATQSSLSIDHIERKELILPSGVKSFEWHFDFQDGDVGHIRFVSTGFTMFIRQEPKLMTGNPHMMLDQRGGISFDRTIPKGRK